MNPRSSLGVAEIIFYAPILILACVLAFIRHGRPRMPWICLVLFSAARIACGIVSILYERDRSDTGLLIGVIILLNVGVIPLLLSTIGFVRLIVALDHGDSERFRKLILLTRLGFLIGIALLVAGGVLQGDYTHPDLAHTGATLGKAGYLVIAGVLLVMIGFEVFFWIHRHRLGRSSIRCLSAISAAMPFQIIRITYALLAVFATSSGKWNALTGSLGAFIGMALIMEYIVVVMYITTGFMIERVRPRAQLSEEEVAQEISSK